MRAANGADPDVGPAIVVVSGTNRTGSRTLGVARQVADLYRTLGAEVRLLDLAELPPALFRPDAYGEKPEAFRPFAEAVLAADGLVVVTPEYNGGFPGVLKYFIDMLKFPESFEERPVCFIGLAAGMWGALRPVEQLAQVFAYRNAHLFPGRVFIPRIGSQVDPTGAGAPISRSRSARERSEHLPERRTPVRHGGGTYPSRQSALSRRRSPARCRSGDRRSGAPPTPVTPPE